MSCYKIIDTGKFKVLDLLPISSSGTAEAYYTCFDGDGDYSTGFSVNLYKKLGLEQGICGFYDFCSWAGIDPKSVRTARLTHFTNIAEYVNEKPDQNFPAGWDIMSESDCPHMDGLVTDSDNIVIMLYAADCELTVLLDPVNRVIGGFHSAWKGSLSGIIENTVSKMVETGAERKNIIAVCGPVICKDCMEVGYDDCAKLFVEAGYGEFVAANANGKFQLDLMGINKKQLLAAGLTENNILSVDDCTVHSKFHNGNYMFSSYRRAKKLFGTPSNGQNALFIRLKSK